MEIQDWFASIRQWPAAAQQRIGLLAALLVTFMVMVPSLNNEWLNWDDQSYVLRNPMVWELNGESVGEMFTTPEQVGLYHPLTMLSLATDYHFWEQNAFGFHLTNLLFHLLNVLLVFFLLQRLGRNAWWACLGAIIFGIHPMHVESVAWISTRKDVLYTAFFLLSFLAYLRYIQADARRPWLWYGGMILLFAAALLSKAIAFIFPLLLFLIDYHQRRPFSWRLILEKVPLFFLAGITLYVATLGQQSSDSMESVDAYPLWKTVFIGARNANIYLGKFVAPLNLSPFHPFPFYGGVEIPWWYYLTALPWLGIAGAMWWGRKKHRELVFGMAFFMVAMGPYLQILPYGKAITAERYTYVAYLGLIVVLLVALERVGEWKKTVGKWAIGVLVGLWLVGMAVETRLYLPVWKDGDTLWSHVIEDYPDHYFAYLSRAKWETQPPNPRRVRADLDRCIELNPNIAEAWYERARLLEGKQQWDAAFEEYSRALELDPTLARAAVNRGLIRAQRRRDMAGALQDFNLAVEAQPDYALGYLNRGLAHLTMKNIPAARADYDRAVELEPWNAVFRRYRGSFLLSQNDQDAAEADFTAAIESEPTNPENYRLRAQARQSKGDPRREEDLDRARELER